MLSSSVPGSQFQETEHVHFVNLLHAPSGVQQGDVGGIHKLRQGQFLSFVPAGFIGKSFSTAVV